MAQSKPAPPDNETEERIQRVIKEFLSRYTGLFETRIQKLIFYTEIYCIAHYQKRITEATYKPFMYGAYSEDVRDTLKTMDGITRERSIRHGERTILYSIEHCEFENDVIHKIIERIHEYTYSIATSKLAKFSKDSWLFEQTEYSQPMQFSQLVEVLEEQSELKEELLEELPPEVQLSEEEHSELLEVTD